MFIFIFQMIFKSKFKCSWLYIIESLFYLFETDTQIYVLYLINPALT